jgi:hypothetical protein
MAEGTFPFSLFLLVDVGIYKQSELECDLEIDNLKQNNPEEYTWLTLSLRRNVSARALANCQM